MQWKISLDFQIAILKYIKQSYFYLDIAHKYCINYVNVCMSSIQLTLILRKVLYWWKRTRFNLNVENIAQHIEFYEWNKKQKKRKNNKKKNSIKLETTHLLQFQFNLTCLIQNKINLTYSRWVWSNKCSFCLI